MSNLERLADECLQFYPYGIVAAEHLAARVELYGDIATTAFQRMELWYICHDVINNDSNGADYVTPDREKSC